jgi:hypothetical protein
MAASRTPNAAKPVLVLELTATKETASTVRFDTTEEWNEANGGRGTNIYIPKSAIPKIGGLGSSTLRVEIFPA